MPVDQLLVDHLGQQVSWVLGAWVLEELELSDNPIGAAGAAHLGLGLSTNSTLTSLKLDNCQVSTYQRL